MGLAPHWEPIPAAPERTVVSPTVEPLLRVFKNTAPNVADSNQVFAFVAATITGEDYGQMRVDETLSNSDTLFECYTVDDRYQISPSDYPTVTMCVSLYSFFDVIEPVG